MAELSIVVQELFTVDGTQYFISWATGTIRWHSGSAASAGLIVPGKNCPAVLEALKTPEMTLV